jgi:sulfur-oxidizing protein SoxB
MRENACSTKYTNITGRGLLAPVLLMSSLALSACSGNSSSSGAAAAPTVPFEILWMNDTHGYFVPTYHAEYTEVDSYAATAATEGTVGGYARIAALVKGFKAKATDAVFVDGGDTFDGSPMAQLTQGTAVVPVLNAMGIDVGIPGNRDFAWNKESFLAVVNGGTTTGTQGGLNGFSGSPGTTAGVTAAGTTSPGLKYPLIAANLLDATATSLPVLPRYYIKQTPNLKVAFIGITSPLAGGTKKADGTQGFVVEGQAWDATTGVAGANVPAGFKIENEISSLAATIRQKENPDLVVVISHMGYFQDRKFASRSTGIDVIVGAHTHHNVTTPPAIPNADGSRKVVVVQAGSHGKYLGKLDLQVSGKQVVGYTNTLVRVTDANVKTYAPNGVPDPDVQALADAAYAPFKTQFDTVVGYTTTVIERRGDTQSTMSSFLADAMSSIFGVDVSSFGGIRYGSSIPGSVAAPAPITYGDVVNMISPNITSGNATYVGTTTGTAILNSLNSGLNAEYGADIYNWGGGDVTRYNGNVRYTYNITAADGAHIVDLSVKSGGVTFSLVAAGVQNAPNLAKIYTMAGFNSSITGAVMTPALTAVDQIVAYIKAQPSATVGPKLDDRAVCLDKASQPAADPQSGSYQCYGPGGI